MCCYKTDIKEVQSILSCLVQPELQKQIPSMVSNASEAMSYLIKDDPNDSKKLTLFDIFLKGEMKHTIILLIALRTKLSGNYTDINKDVMEAYNYFAEQIEAKIYFGNDIIH